MTCIEIRKSWLFDFDVSSKKEDNCVHISVMKVWTTEDLYYSKTFAKVATKKCGKINGPYKTHTNLRFLVM